MKRQVSRGRTQNGSAIVAILKTLLKTDPVLKILRTKLIGPLNKPISVPPARTNKLDAINLILRMLDDMGFCANAFDGDDLLSFILEQLEDARSKLMEIMRLMVDKATNPKDNIAIPSESLRERLAGSPHYASADSEI